MDNPSILALNLTSKAIKILIDNGYNVVDGNIGKIIDTKNKKYEHKYCLLNRVLPANTHEFDIVIIDFSNEEVINYVKEDHVRLKSKDRNNSYFLCKSPQTLFDSRAYTSKTFLSAAISEIIKRDSIIVIFQGENVVVDYQVVEENGESPRLKGDYTASIYDCIPNIPFVSNKLGTHIEVVAKDVIMQTFLNKYKSDFTYENIFHHPTFWSNVEYVQRPEFIPIIQNRNGEIISFMYSIQKGALYMFPRLEDNSSFLLDFIYNIAPVYQPQLFPELGLSKWTNLVEYSLPNHLQLIEEKKNIQIDYEKRISSKDSEIRLNLEKYNYLHSIITETGDLLVDAIIKYLEWLGFENVVDMDKNRSGVKEEDIQIENERGLLAIEVKGIGGTSKDSECSQIAKVKYRRAKERNKFDVYALYIVNHQRHLPPLKRENPPFSENQIQDALSDERGLLTTWQLFNLYSDVLNGIITKEEARSCFYQNGLISFKPSNIKFIGIIEEIFKDGFVFILKLDDVLLSENDILYIEKNGRFDQLMIKGIMINSKKVETATNCEVGINVDKKVSKKTKIWFKS